MRISEILFWNNEPIEKYRADPQLDLPQVPFSEDLTKACKRLHTAWVGQAVLESERIGRPALWTGAARCWN